MRFSRLRLNRTLLLRQHLLERVAMDPTDMIGHLVGLQAQEPLSPYLSLAARLTDLDPVAVSAAIEDRSLVRVLSLRDTVHLHLPADAVTLPVWAAPVREREMKVSQTIGTAREVDRSAFSTAVHDVLADGPLPQRRLGAALAERFPAYTATQLGQVARIAEVLVQLPPRGCWKPTGSTAVAYDHAERWTGLSLTEPDVPAIVRRYLAAFGPSTAADMTAWSGITRLGPVVKAMADLEVHEDEDGKVLYDVPGAPVADEDAPAPVRLLGNYDNVWLSHAGRDRVTAPEHRRLWMGANGAQALSIYVDGWLAGLWRVEDGRVTVVEMVRDLTRTERAGLDEEIARVETLLAH
ncbi:winged helix DNA-binding domain-containing protein [Nocardioides daeguensis]|uniref:Winged helix DNA-binding domain-containing protein n=1 Tax=Nocardioides daeguensis TaxID=908359 RepID=A0ABP6VQZ4_9ACTN|nr:winged helix DNA-binding domain-containing protein [Nocardioides daeguensis]MBV6727440.1 winged helix DNA-binding domain-containing protein [Nocardioides daeguensis]MCR1775530.1 winged helix DNA-binding domain-containing protein [Nocardioides daeguensis]